MYEKNAVMTDLESAREYMEALFEQMRDKGVGLYVDGETALPSEAAARSVRENSPYMADYVFGDAGKLEHVRFDRVTEQ